MRLAALLILPILATAKRCGGDGPKPDDTAPPGDTDTSLPEDTAPPDDTAPPCETTLTVDDLQPRDLVITELMLRPLTSDGHWLEFANTSGCPVNLAGLTISVDGSDELHWGRSEDFEPGAHVTVASSPRAEDNGGFEPDWTTNALDLDHSHASVTLLAHELPIDRVIFSNGVWYSDDYTGASHALTDEAMDAHGNDAVANWCLSYAHYGDGSYRGTPGEPNGACVGSVFDADGDGWTRSEAGGPDCDDFDDTFHPGARELCADGEDNNCDGNTDCLDASCGVTDGCEDCSDGSDDDGDGLVDCEDGDCANDFPCYEDCGNGSDDDLDGLVDCEDDECWGGICHPAGVKAQVQSGGFQHQRHRHDQTGESEVRGWCYGVGGYNETNVTTATSVRGTVQVLPEGVSSWDATTARSTCTWSVREAQISVFQHPSYWAGPVWSAELNRSDVQIGGGCRLYEPWFLPDVLFRAGDHVLYAGYAYALMGGLPVYQTSPWYALVPGWVSRDRHHSFESSSLCDGIDHSFETTSSTGWLDSSLDPLLVIP